MELTTEFKQTEVGPIPNDWEVKRLGEISDVQRGASPRPISSPIWFDDNSKVGWVRISDVPQSGMFLCETTQRLSILGIQHSRPVSRGSLIMSICATVGRPIITDIDVCIHDGFVVLDNLSVDQRFLYYVLVSIEDDWAKHGQTGSQMNLNTGLINRTVVALPRRKKEQRAIAAALSDVDALIAALDTLIAKKRAIKTAAMQQLLTGQQRLPGFSGAWETKRLGEHLRFQVGFPFSSVHFNQDGRGLRLVKNRDLKADDQVFYYDGSYDSAFVVKNGDVLIGMDGDFMPCVWNRGRALLNQRIGRIQAGPELDLTFAYYALHEPLLQIQHNTSGTTVKHLSHGDVASIEIDLPFLNEQRAIAAVLSDMDAEIEALDVRRAKTQQLKQGMMQELLTGRTRLVVKEASSLLE